MIIPLYSYPAYIILIQPEELQKNLTEVLEQ